MAGFILAQENTRRINNDDDIFILNTKAKEMAARLGSENIANAAIGTLIDDHGKLVVLSSVEQTLRSLSIEDFAEYAPIDGLASFQSAAIAAVFEEQLPDCPIAAVATPGGTGALHNVIQNYSRRGDIILTSDWHWGPYRTIAEELERKLETYPMFDEDNRFDIKSFSDKVHELLKRQDRLVLLLNTPAHNPTGYSLNNNDWDAVLDVLKNEAADPNKSIALLIDVAYIDFADDPATSRFFLPKLTGLPQNILPLIAFSMSKSFMLYGMRTGAIIALSPNKDIIDEFRKVMIFTNRGTWSNGTRAGMVVLSRIYADPELLARTKKERIPAMRLLADRGKTFIKAAADADLAIYPYNAGFFAVVHTNNPTWVSEQLQQDGIFTVPLDNRGLRISLASASEHWCRIIPAKIAALTNR
ncbi:MAG TPA: aminotransferase class I/II-fold pyridoxal phosphate-dependent enzyme [Clostridiales bacterium]|jgi:aromatic-amino-acid transaminase|nr:aminotransferase class I/II-fold pyridoxal phosphate-dependent enzyme [Clostridiales bacterium]